MNIKSLLQNDISNLKNIKLDDVRSQLQSRPMMGLKVLLVVVAVGVLVFGWSAGNKRKQALINDLNEKKTKLQVYQELQTIKGDYSAFLKNLPQSIARDALIKEISELAEKNNIKIGSFVPNERKFNDLVKANILELNLMADSYEDLNGFIESIEKSSYLLRVERWSGRMIEVAFKEGQQEPGKIIEARMEVAGLVINQDGQSAK